jgi:AcrR family transcriptional regulator
MAAKSKTAFERKRIDPRRETTRAKLIDSAEEMFAEAGIEGVSLRQIGIAIGSANTTVIAYHFGSKEALIEAILQDRMPQLEARRAELLTIAEQEGQSLDIEALNRIQCLPLFEMKNAKGHHCFAGFLGSVGRADWTKMRMAIDRSFPVTKELERRIANALPKKTLPFLEERTFAAIAVITIVLQRIDRTCPHDRRRAERMFADAMRMVTALITAPTE